MFAAPHPQPQQPNQQPSSDSNVLSMLSSSSPSDTEPSTAAPHATEMSKAAPGVELSQPPVAQPMNAQAPHDDSDDATLRGGRSAMCPGRFCFIIPCPIPCDFCII